MNLLNKTLGLLNIKEKKLIYFLSILFVLSMLLEVISLGAIIPIISTLLDHNELGKNLNFLNNIFFINLISNLEITYIFASFIIIFLIKNVFIYCTWIFKSFVLNKITARLSKEIFQHYSFLDYENFTEKKTAEMVNITSNIVDTFKETLGNIIILFSEIVVFIGIVTFLILIEPKSISLITSIALFLSLLFYFINKNILSEWGKKIKINREGKLQILFQSLSSIKNIKILNNQNFFTKTYNYFNLKEYKFIHLSTVVSILPRYIFEMMGVSLIIISIIFMTKINIPKNEIIIILSIIGLASFRVLPAVARITNSLSLIRFYKYSVDVIHSELRKDSHKEKHDG